MATLHKKDRGFSLVEILLVLSLLGIMIAIGAPYFLFSRINTDLRMQAQAFQADLEMARSLARRGGTNAVLIHEGSPTAVSGYRVQDPEGQVKKSVRLRNNVFANYSGLTGTTANIEFTRNGSCTKSGTITLKAPGTAKTFTLRIEPVTGFIKLTES